MQKFVAEIYIIGVNPYVFIPPTDLKQIQNTAEKNKGPIPVKGKINGKPFIQTLIKYAGEWRLYLNTPIRRVTNTQVGDKVKVEIEFDSKPRLVQTPPQLAQALEKNKMAKDAFEKLPAYRQKEIKRYIAHLKSEQTIARNIEKIIKYLRGKEVKGVLFGRK